MKSSLTMMSLLSCSEFLRDVAIVAVVAATGRELCLLEA